MPYIREPKLICPECGKAIQNRNSMRMHYLRWHTDAWEKATQIAERAERRYDEKTEAWLAKGGVFPSQKKEERLVPDTEVDWQ